jgi:hypothetical protein
VAHGNGFTGEQLTIGVNLRSHIDSLLERENSFVDGQKVIATPAANRKTRWKTSLDRARSADVASPPAATLRR